MKHGYAPQHCHIIDLEAPNSSVFASYVELDHRLLLSPVQI
jgi:hypothetical protein